MKTFGTPSGRIFGDAWPLPRLAGRVCLTVLLAVLGLLRAPGVYAGERMYAWQDPDSGTLQLTGTPPPWYASRAPGPRVRVFEKGRLVDDSAWQEARPAAPAPAPPVAATDAGTPTAADARRQQQEFKALLDAWDATRQAAPGRGAAGSALPVEPAR